MHMCIYLVIMTELDTKVTSWIRLCREERGWGMHRAGWCLGAGMAILSMAVPQGRTVAGWHGVPTEASAVVGLRSWEVTLLCKFTPVFTSFLVNICPYMVCEQVVGYASAAIIGWRSWRVSVDREQLIGRPDCPSTVWRRCFSQESESWVCWEQRTFL